ncbi:MAG: magnesium/cobalt transporter CorA [Deltaproteobacteria bacterium]|nr:magnesium/cobalt transporter CorA [Deltaproteobacteria bacterium]
MFKKHRPPVGAPPGALVVPLEAIVPRIHVIDYTGEHLVEREVGASELGDLLPMKKSKSVTWVDVQGLGDVELLREIGQIFDIHPLALSDIVHIPQRPKAEEYDSSVFITTFMIETSSLPLVHIEQISIFLGQGFVLTFQQNYGDIFDQLRQRLRQAKGSIRRYGADYLVYALLDAIIDNYYPVLEDLGEYLEEVERKVIEKPSTDILKSIYTVRCELLNLRRAIFPQREVLNFLIRDDSKLFKKTTHVYLRDCYDHCAQVIEVIETYREICSGLMDVYLSGLSNKMNEVIKVLTIISTIFIPLSFFAGVYGMNFHYMPELQLKWAYPAFWVVIVSLAIGMLLFFRKRGWLGSTDKSDETDEIDEDEVVNE